MAKRSDFLLDSPYLKKKYESLTQAQTQAEQRHKEHLALMDRWHEEAQEQKAKKKPEKAGSGIKWKLELPRRKRRKSDVKTKGKSRKHGRRKESERRSRKKDQPHNAREQSSASEAGGGDGFEYGERGQTDTGGGIHSGEEKEVEK